MIWLSILPSVLHISLKISLENLVSEKDNSFYFTYFSVLIICVQENLHDNHFWELKG